MFGLWVGGATLHPRGVHDRPPQPALQRPIATESRSAIDRLSEGFLYSIAGSLRVTDDHLRNTAEGNDPRAI
jgi:hypothetical protein